MTAPKAAFAPTDATQRFLRDTLASVEKTYPFWEKRLATFVEETALDFEDKRRLMETHPLKLYFYSGVVAMEAAKIPTLFSEEASRELLADISENVGKVMDRHDRFVSDLVFDMIYAIQVHSDDETKKPHDEIMKKISSLIHLSSMEATKDLTKDVVFRQDMAEPLARSVVHWWKLFKQTYRLAEPLEGFETPVVKPELGSSFASVH